MESRCVIDIDDDPNLVMQGLWSKDHNQNIAGLEDGLFYFYSIKCQILNLSLIENELYSTSSCVLWLRIELCGHHQ
jgi:ligand-binding sensor domain-containing protein